MVKTVKVPMVGPSGHGRVTGVNLRRAVNVIMESDDAAGKEKVIWIGTPGKKLWTTTSDIVRGWLNWKDTYLYFVAGTSLYRADTAGTVSASLGTLATSSGTVSMARNRTEILICDGSVGSYYVFETGTDTLLTVSAWSTVTPISTMTRSGVTVTIYAVAHGGTTGQKAKILGANRSGYNTPAGQDTTITVSDADHFTYPITIAFLTTVVVDSLTSVGTTCTVTTHMAHGFTSGKTVLIAGAANAGWNTYQGPITVTSATAFTFTMGVPPPNENPAVGVNVGQLPDTPDGGLNGQCAIRTQTLSIQPQRCTQMDSYGILQNARTSLTDGVHTGQFYITHGDDFTTVQAASVSVAQRDPGAMLVPYAPDGGGHLFLLCEYSCEVWYDDGNSALTPFVPIRTAAIPWGVLAPWSVASLGPDEGFAWLGRQKRGPMTVFYLDAGYKPMEIASKAVSYALSQASTSDLTSATAFSWKELGHDFYALTFGNQTWVYDLAESKTMGFPCWTEWTSYNGTAYGRNRAAGHVFFAGYHLVSDYAYGKVLQLDYATYTDLDNTSTRQIQRLGVSGYVHSEDKALTFARVFVDMEPAGANGQLRLESSDDKGTSWTDHGVKIFSGAAQRLEWFNLGESRTDRVFRLSTTDPVKFAILGMWADVEAGDA